MPSNADFRPLRHRGPPPLLRAAAAVLLVLCATPPARAGGPPAESLSAAVPVGDLDLASVQGQQAARQRLGAAAAQLCARFRDTRSLAVRETEGQCRADALATALRQIEPRIVAQDRKAPAERKAPPY